MEGIKDKVAIIGMGCTKFGENWDKDAEDMIVEAAYEAYKDAGIEPNAIQAAWVGTRESGSSGASLATPLKLQDIPITRAENFCATGMEAFRMACFGVASGLYDIVLALGFEKLKDSGISGRGGVTYSVVDAGGTAPGRFGLPFARYSKTFGATREHLAKIAVKNHRNGARCPRAHFQREITIEQALNAPIIAWPHGLFDCCPTTDGSAAAIICRADMARNFRADYILVRALGLAVSPGRPAFTPGRDFLHWPPTVHAARQAYEQAGIREPLKDLDCVELHDCFTTTELLTYEDLGFCRKGEAKDYVDAGVFTLEGELPVNTDGGLKSFGHPIGASGIRMIFELYKQLQGKVDGPRQVKNAQVGLAHNLGGPPNVCSITIVTSP
jgi:acetyl-CoA C-acetyltransferase